MPRLDVCGKTDVGLVRTNNEDQWSTQPDLSLAIVADGMGGAACGEIAASMAIETICQYLREPAEDLEPLLSLKEAIRQANRVVWKRAQNEGGCGGMGTTIVSVLWQLPHVIIANVGDSRAYLWRAGNLSQLSYDQSLVNELRVSLGLTEEQIMRYAGKNILTMAIGTSEEVLIRTKEEDLEPADEILLCSDGLYGPVGDHGIAGILASGGSIEERVERLVAAARAAGGPDNITAVLLRYAE